MTGYTYVGFGFGAIQPGLFLYDAYRSGVFRRYVVAEILPDLVHAMRQHDGWYTGNLAGSSSVRQITLGPVELLDVGVAGDRERLIAAVAEAHEIGTAITTFNGYVMDIPGSLHLMLAEGLRRKVAENGPAAVIYAAENHNQAARLLEDAVMSAIPAQDRDAVRGKAQFVNTVISKMCGLVTDPAAIAEHHLATMWPDGESQRALLVEDYDLLLINKIRLPGFERGISLYQEKIDLLPFKEAKLFGHNGTHALAAYIGGCCGAERIAELRRKPGVLAFLRNAFLEEIGAALIRKYATVDPLFTQAGFAQFVDGVLARMVNPYLLDTTARVGRDPRRKLGWDDRLVGAIRVALSYNVQPRRYAFGVIAALAMLDPQCVGDPSRCATMLTDIWLHQNPDAAERDTVLEMILSEREAYRAWQRSGYVENVEDYL